MTRYSLKLNKFITLVTDEMFVNGTPFLITISRITKFVTVEHVPTCKYKQLSKYFKRVVGIYYRSSMLVQTVFIETYFGNTIEKLMYNVIINTSTAK